ncbi:MAG: hypothetical protein MUC29_15050 [Pyrinomonadaceae bacterium]|nr:hypothetical protein [Pyrinomonadaceae bacterium]
MEEKVLIEEKDLIEIKQSSQDVELFKDYEVNKFRITPSLYKIVIASFLINTVFGFSLSQMDLFQQKACDSAYIGKVCQVLDAAYVGSKFFGTTRTTVDEPYEKTEFDTSDITWINKDERFQYPEGYFFKEEPVQEPLAGNEFAMVNGGDGKSTNPGAFLPPGANPFTTTPSNPTTTIPNNPTTTTPPSTKLDIKKPPVLPKQNNQMKPSDFDGLSIVNTVNSGEKTSTPKKKDEPKKTPNDNNTAGVDPKDKQPTSDKTAGKKQIDPKNSQLEIKNFNKKPLEDYRVRAKEILKAGIDSNAVFAVTMKGVLTKDGKLDSSLSNWGNDTVGDPKLVDLVKDGSIKA